MFEYKKIKADLEEYKCPVHGEAAKISFKEGILIVENFCCEEHKRFLLANLPHVTAKEDTELLLNSVTA